MNRLFALLLAALLLAVPLLACAQSAVDVQGFWYSGESDIGIELKKGKVIISNADGETTGEGAYQADTEKFSFEVGGVAYACTVSGNGMLVDAGDGIKHYARDGVEENFWTNVVDDSAIELYGGQVWLYDDAGDLTGEGSYEIEDNVVTMTVDGKTLVGTIEDGEMTVGEEVYTIL